MLLSPMKIGNLEIKNRTVMTAAEFSMGQANGKPTEKPVGRLQGNAAADAAAAMRHDLKGYGAGFGLDRQNIALPRQVPGKADIHNGPDNSDDNSLHCFFHNDSPFCSAGFLFPMCKCLQLCGDALFAHAMVLQRQPTHHLLTVFR